jgi:transposase-like protein
VRARGGQEFALPGRERAVEENWLRRWAMSLMRIGVTTRRFGQAVRLPEADVPAGPGSGVSKSAGSRRFVALSAERLTAWLDADLSRLDLLAVQIDGIHLAEDLPEDLLKDLPLVAAVGIDGEGRKLSLGLIEGATENAAVVQALLDGLAKRGLDPPVPRLSSSTGRRRCRGDPPELRARDADPALQVHKARNILDRLPRHLHASTRRVPQQTWDLDDAERAETLLCNLPRSLEREAPGLAGVILEGLDEILTVVRLGLPKERRRSLACTNIIETIMGSVRRVCRNVTRWRDASLALCWTPPP